MTKKHYNTVTDSFFHDHVNYEYEQTEKNLLEFLNPMLNTGEMFSSSFEV